MGDTDKRSPDGGPCKVDVGVVLEQRETENPWQEWAWRACLVVPSGGPEGE
jgi:hypothetical protein